MKARVFAVSLLALPVGFCAHKQEPDIKTISGGTFCQIVKRPMLWHRDDTRLTKEQMDALNRKGKELCGWGRKVS